ncbi:uncharacterized protein TRIADDRAFT_54902 [Trichoplax adhaerens]|uniref:Globin domain-containing protein n=1 Tax=Trichoplax adhaerens TaxID=10228 RepID=B3RTB3_TRIAD|nr:predicted protein [Trichoplax adhaerens]EDV26664.1 predicted protein [Trichoplax adhaerens]|eukprot:XP_002110660.1 predicted protein [Trichoplax adhaerens]
MKDLIKDPLVRSHGLRFMKAIETMLEIEFDSNGCIFLFSAIGNRHCSYGIEADYLDYVPQAFRFMLTKALGNNYTDKIASVWDEILSHIIKAMQDKVREGTKLKEDKEEVARRISSAYLTDKKREDCKSTTNGSEDSPNVM